MTDHLTPLDATFLELEQADEAAHMHIGGALVFDPRADGSVPSLAQLREHLGQRLGHLPRYHRRLSEPRTGGLRWPAWEDDERAGPPRGSACSRSRRFRRRSCSWRPG